MGGTGEHEGRSAIARVGCVLFGADRQVGEWVGQKIPGFTLSEKARALGVVKGRRLVAGVVFERWNGVHVEASIAAEKGAPWADRRTLHSLFHYPFVTLGCLAITVTVPASNLQSLNLATKLGFEPEAIVKFAAHDGSALIVLKMFRETCKWIENNGQGRQTTTSTGRTRDSTS